MNSLMQRARIQDQSSDTLLKNLAKKKEVMAL
jgi:hypothetical protein